MDQKMECVTATQIRAPMSFSNVSAHKTTKWLSAKITMSQRSSRRRSSFAVNIVSGSDNRDTTQA